MNLVEQLEMIPQRAIKRRFRVRGRLVETVTMSQEANMLLSDTFYPPGMFAADEVFEDAGTPNLIVVDRQSNPEEVCDLLAMTAASAPERDYELTRNFRLPRFDADGYSLFVLQDVNSDESAALVRTDRQITIVRPASMLGDRWLTRVVRDAATRYAKADGSLIMHSAAFVYEGAAYLVIGDSGAGKSTTAIALARLLDNAAWMGNDRMHLDLSDGRYRVTACPLPLAVNKGSLDVMGIHDIADWKLHAGFPKPGSDWDQHMGEDKLKMSSQEVEKYLGVRVQAEATLAGIILPQVTLGATYETVTAPREHAVAVMTRNCLSADDNLYGEDWLAITAAPTIDPPSIEAFLDAIEGVSLLRCSIGGAADVAKLAADVRAVLAT
jgi:hypothetical protein